MLNGVLRKKSCAVWGIDLTLSGSDSWKDSQYHCTAPWLVPQQPWSLQVKAGGLIVAGSVGAIALCAA